MNDPDPNIIRGGCAKTTDPQTLRTPGVSSATVTSYFWGFRVVLNSRTLR